MCEKNDKNAERNVKSTLNAIEKVIGDNISTVPTLLGMTSSSDNHFVFTTKINKDRAEEFINQVEDSDLSSWNVIAVRVGDARKSGQDGGIQPGNTRHYSKCEYPGYGPI